MATPQGKAPAFMPAPLPEPPPVPMSGVTPARKAIAPQLSDEPKGANPERAFADRQRAAIAKATGASDRKQDQDAGEDAAPAPKGTAGSAAPGAPKPSTTTAAGKSTDSKPAAGAATNGSNAPADSDAKPPAKADASSSADSEPAAHRYTLQSLKKWAEDNAEEAAEVLTKLGRLSPDSATDWIKLKNGERKVRQRIRGEHEKSYAEVKAERDAADTAKAAIDQAAGKLAPIADLWEAVAESVTSDPQNPRIDFEAADAAFLENAKISIDDYMRLRARRSIGSSADAVKLRAENARLRRENAGKPSDAIKTTAAGSPPSPKEEAGTAEPAATTKPAGKAWDDELPAKHKLRQFEGWNKTLDTEMRKYLDPDTGDYDADPEAIADALLKREIERLTEDDEPAPAPARARPAANGKPARAPTAKDGVPSASELTPRKRAPEKVEEPDEEEENAKVGGMTFAQRTARALKRHEERRQGIRE